MFGFYYFCNVKVNRKTYIRLLFLWNLLALLPFSIQANSEESKCPVVKIVPEQLADLNIPRSGHTVFIAHGEVTVIGGHTSGFIPTPTAEYYKDGKWHLLQTVYEHDGGFSVVLKSGKVIIGGGFEKHLGIGQTFVVETYDPSSGHYGVDVVSTGSQLIKATLDGTVVYASWTLDYGYTIGIQHENNYLSNYKHNATLLKKEGDFVKAGEAIAILGASGELTDKPLLHFELWRQGTPMNPTDYIDFEKGEE